MNRQAITHGGTLLTCVVAAMGVMTSCYRPGPPPQRTYDEIQAPQVDSFLLGIFLQRGFTIGERNPSMGYVRTDWLAEAGQRHGMLTWQQRRSYESDVRADLRIENRVHVFLRAFVEERPTENSDWSNKPVEMAADAISQSILAQLDSVVTQSGGRDP